MKQKDFFNIKRLRFLQYAAYFAVALIAFRLTDIQLISHEKYALAAEQNRTQILYQTAPRGRILTAKGQTLAGNVPSFSLYYLPGSQRVDGEYLSSLSADVSSFLGTKSKDILKLLNKGVKSGKAVLIAQNISPKRAFAFSELQVYYSGLYLLEETKRDYPYGAFAAHLLGYMGTMDNKFWNKKEENTDYRLNSKIGKSGIEKRYESELKGIDGGLYLEVDYKGRVKQKLKDNKWRRGSDVWTTLNLEVQKAAENGIKKSITGRGAAVVLDAKTGAVLAMVSAPDFDPNIFISYSDEEIPASAKKIPEYNLALQGMYPPASTFKTITAIAALENERLDLHEHTTCKGKIFMSGREFKCWKTHGPNIDLMEGMAQSCDVYFYELALKTGAASIEKIQRLFHLGQKTGIDLPGEKSGNIYGPSKRARNRTYWFAGDTLNLSIGQGELLLTPLQMAVYGAALASKGNIYKPYYIQKIVNPQGQILVENKPEIIAHADLKEGHYEIIHQALKGVVDRATGRAARVEGIDVYGKTGTAQNPHGDDHGWFLAFAGLPGQEPDIALSVFVEFGKGGSSAAAPIAREIIKAYYGVK